MAKASRRKFTQRLIAAGMAATAEPLLAATDLISQASRQPSGVDGLEVDYIVVGGGAGGGPLAARLARAGYTVALLEAGIDPRGAEALAIDPNAGTFYDLPALLAAAAEYPQLSWDFYVKHFSDPAVQAQDSKYVPGKGILYPRGSALGGSTAHNAMVFMYPHDKDFDDIAEATGDQSWRSDKMRKYFQRLEHCDYCDFKTPGRGDSGYINSTMLDKRIEELYPEIRDLADAGQTYPWSYTMGNTLRDANHPLVAKGDVGAFKAPMHVAKNVRISIREYLLNTQAELPGKLFLITGTLATKVMLKDRRAVGIEYMRGANLYEADKLYNPTLQPRTYKMRARKEVILSAGVYNTPQLLKLSGIGPREELEALNIPVVQDLPGVGSNLQDRYEISVNVELKNIIDFYSQCKLFQPDDPCLTTYKTGVGNGLNSFYGPYANNAIYSVRIAKSNWALDLPDLCIVGLAIPYRGIFPGFSYVTLGHTWSWLVLKAHTRNTAGTVKLKSTDPRQMPDINFHYFEEGNDRRGADMDAVLAGLKMARGFVAQPEAAQHISHESYPGPQYQSDVELKQYIHQEAWGHHAACTAKIGADHDRMAVLDSRFRVRGVRNLRVVDACAFPRVPGFFPVAAVMMIGEKAADTILEEEREHRA